MKKMQKLLVALGMVLGVSSLFSCSEATYESHQTFFYPQEPQGMIFYADQTSDTTRVYSLDSWNIVTEGEWFDVSPKSCEIEAGKYGDTKLQVTATPNLTGENRQGVIRVNAYHSVAMRVNQVKWLNILYPYAKYKSQGEEDTFANRIAEFEMNLIHNAKSGVVKFTVYADGATLTSDAEWLKPELSKFPKGTHTVKLEVEDNTGTTVRRGTLKLTSAGISTDIVVEQDFKQVIK